jgi:delta8-fatty-acid desaturase
MVVESYCPFPTPISLFNFTHMQQWSRAEVAARILAGDTLIIYHGHLLSVPQKWLDTHPGGSLALLHFIGRDASAEIEAYHFDDALKLIPRYSIGRVELTDGIWEPFLPPIATGWVRKVGPAGQLEWFKEATEVFSNEDSQFYPSSSVLLVPNGARAKQSAAPTLASLQPQPSTLSPKEQARQLQAWRELHKRITAAGLYKTCYITGYGPELLRYTVLAALSVYFYSQSWFITSAVFLGLLWHQLVFTAHDLGHMGVTHNWTADRIIATIIADFIGGLSIGWWVHVCCRLLNIIFRPLTPISLEPQRSSS